MLVMAVIVFISLHFKKAGYGYLRNSKWGIEINNKVAWILMELPSFLCILVLLIVSGSYTNIAVTVMAGLFLMHYLQRTFIFPLLMRGNSTMPLSIMFMGIFHNLLNTYLIGAWLFYPDILDGNVNGYPAGGYNITWLCDPRFIIGTCIFLFGFVVNLQSDYIVRHLRKPGDTKHYIPMGGMFKYVSSANYFGEITEWVGFAILTWSLSGVVFAAFTFANLAPRAFALYNKYEQDFGEEFTRLKRKKIIPFIY